MRPRLRRAVWFSGCATNAPNKMLYATSTESARGAASASRGVTLKMAIAWKVRSVRATKACRLPETMEKTVKVTMALRVRESPLQRALTSPTVKCLNSSMS
uniref:Uncharacterized protein n=1 Tax=Tetraselmis chuii TaxID=63592 RepID=A0A7S1SMS4_9CHLO